MAAAEQGVDRNFRSTFMTELSTLNLRAETSGLLVYTEVSALSITRFALFVKLLLLCGCGSEFCLAQHPE